MPSSAAALTSASAASKARRISWRSISSSRSRSPRGRSLAGSTRRGERSREASVNLPDGGTDNDVLLEMVRGPPHVKRYGRELLQEALIRGRQGGWREKLQADTDSGIYKIGHKIDPTLKS